jgi:hypothetical protein
VEPVRSHRPGQSGLPVPGPGRRRLHQLLHPYQSLSYIGNTLGKLELPNDKPRIHAFNIGDIPNTPNTGYLIRDGGNYYSWTSLPFNHAKSTGDTYTDTVNSVTGWNLAYPDGHAAWYPNPANPY